MSLLVYLEPLDTCFFREARSFGAEESTFAASGPPTGLTLYGALGSQVLACYGESLQNFVNHRAKDIIREKLGTYNPELQNNDFAIQGPWLTYTSISGHTELFFPPPANLWVSGPSGNQTALHLIYPEEKESWQGKQWDLAMETPCLRPLALPQPALGAWPPEPGAAYLSATALQQYLAGGMRRLGHSYQEKHFYVRESRAGNRIEPSSWTTAEAFLFFTEHLRFRDALSGSVYRQAGMAVVATNLTPDDLGAASLFLGGERRQVGIRSETLVGKLIPEDPNILATIVDKKRFFIYLATPAIFSQGWRRNWPFEAGAELVAAAVPKPIRLSGWNRGERHADGNPRPFFRLAPAGSVYFFEALEWEAGQFQSLYTRFHCQESLSEKYASAGLGVALVGAW